MKKNNSKYFLYFFIILLLSIQACTSVTRETKPSQVAKIEIGKTTKSDIITLLGLPNKREIKTLTENEKIEFWIYYKAEGRRGTVVPMAVPVGPIIIGMATELKGEEGQNIAAIIAFDKNDIVVDLKTEKGE